MNVAMYETDGFHQDCTLIGEDVLREAGIETTSAKREGPYTYKRTPKHRSHPYTLRDDMVYQTLRSLTATEIGAGTVNVAKMVRGGALCSNLKPERRIIIDIKTRLHRRRGRTGRGPKSTCAT